MFRFLYAATRTVMGFRNQIGACCTQLHGASEHMIRIYSSQADLERIILSRFDCKRPRSATITGSAIHGFFSWKAVSDLPEPQTLWNSATKNCFESARTKALRGPSFNALCENSRLRRN